MSELPIKIKTAYDMKAIIVLNCCDIAEKLREIGDDAGSNAILILIKSIENFPAADVDDVTAERDTALAEVQRLREAGQAVIDIWDTPAWKQTEHTVVSIEALRAAISNNATKRVTFNAGRINSDGLQVAHWGGEENFTPPDRRKELQRELQRIWEELRALGGFDA